MPLYEYQCEECGTVFEALIMAEKDARELRCKKCGGERLKKVLSSANVRLGAAVSQGSLGSTPARGLCAGGFS